MVHAQIDKEQRKLRVRYGDNCMTGALILI